MKGRQGPELRYDKGLIAGKAPKAGSKMKTESLVSRFAATGEKLEHQIISPEEDVLDCLDSSPIGRLLKIISILPEIREEKVNLARQGIECGKYETENSLDAAIDRVIEELTVE